MELKQTSTIEKKIGSNTFFIRPLPAFYAANISGELFSILTPILSSILPVLNSGDEGEDGKGALDTDMEKVLPAMSNAFSSISGDKFEKIMRKLLIEKRNIAVEGEATDGETKVLDSDLANEVFCGEVQDMYILCFEVIRVNFKGFFSKFGTLSGNLQGIFQKLAPKSENTEN